MIVQTSRETCCRSSSRALAVSRVAMSSPFAGKISLLVWRIIFNFIEMISLFTWSIISNSHMEITGDESALNILSFIESRRGLRPSSDHRQGVPPLHHPSTGYPTKQSMNALRFSVKKSLIGRLRVKFWRIKSSA